MTVTLKQNA